MVTLKHKNIMSYLEFEKPNLIERLAFRIRLAYCKKFGCNIQGESHAGPESGGDDIGCVRCGQDYSVTYY